MVSLTFNYVIMKTITHILSITFILFSLFSCQSPDHIFQENENDWFTEGDASWHYDNEELIGNVSDGSGFVMTNKTYKDFVLNLEFFPDSSINSGIFIRCKDYEINPFDCYELNIWDLHPKQEYRTGSLVMRSNPLAWVETIDKWNGFEIVCEGNSIMAWVNGDLTVDIQDTSLSEGHIGLQAAELGQIKFRKVEIRPVK